LEFAEAWSRKREGDYGGVNAWFIGRSDLIRNKREVGRPLDLVDAQNLEQAEADEGVK